MCAEHNLHLLLLRAEADASTSFLAYCWASFTCVTSDLYCSEVSGVCPELSKFSAAAVLVDLAHCGSVWVSLCTAGHGCSEWCGPLESGQASLGRPREALDELLAAEAAASGSGSNGIAVEAAAGQQALASLDDVVMPDQDDDGEHMLLDDLDGDVTSAAAAGGQAGSSASAAAVDVVQVAGGGMNPEQLAALKEEAEAKKLGKMYVAMGGGREGLEACIALEKLIEVGVWWCVCLEDLCRGSTAVSCSAAAGRRC